MADEVGYVQREGSWNRVSSILHGLGNRIEKAVDSESKQQVMRAVHTLKAGIESQSFNHEPLSPEYKAYKGKKGLDERILIATGQYLRSITYWKEGHGKWVVGVRRGATNREGLLLSKLGVWLEYGTSRMPARPHWRPLRAMMRQDIKKGYSTAVRKAMRFV